MKKVIREALEHKQPEAPKDGEIERLADALLLQSLKRPPKVTRDRLPLIRLGLESAGRIGARSDDLHLHQHSLPPVVQQMLESKMLEMMGRRGN